MQRKRSDYLKSIEKWEPKEPDVEKPIIGCCLLELSEEDWKSVEILEPEMFYNHQLGELFEIIKRLRAKGMPVNLTTVSGEILDPDLKREAAVIVAEAPFHIKHLSYFAIIEYQEYLKRSFYTLLCLAPSFFDYSIPLDEFLEIFEKKAKPLFDAIEKGRGEGVKGPETKENEEDEEMLAARNAFVPHYLVKGDEKYKVLMSKYKPYKGYTWINNKAIKEERLLKNGYKISYE